jgi:ElaB/YqjD/DUF883 family membrane-anchored ribosome-binding protein
MAKTAPNEITSNDLETLKEDIQKLRDDLGEMLSSVGSFSKEKLAETRSRLSAAVDGLQGRAYDRLQGTARMVRDRSRYAMDASRGAVEQKPLTYVAVAFLTGVVLASFFEWKRTS